VRVCLRFDLKGNLIAVRPEVAGVGDDPLRESLAKLACEAVWSRYAHAVRRASHESRTKLSTQARRDAAQKHRSNEWLERAHQANPTFGAERLALAARQLLAAAQDRRKGARRNHRAEAKKRDEITEYRADVYLKAIRTKSGEV